MKRRDGDVFVARSPWIPIMSFSVQNQDDNIKHDTDFVICQSVHFILQKKERRKKKERKQQFVPPITEFQKVFGINQGTIFTTYTKLNLISVIQKKKYLLED